MALEILVTENLDLPIKRDLGVVSATTTTIRSDAIAKLQEQAITMGADAVILLSETKVVTELHRNMVCIRGVAVKI